MVQGKSNNPLGDSHPRYQWVQQLNAGTHGQVHLCKDKASGEPVAIKFIPRTNVNKYVLSEILNHRRLNHPHVVQFREVLLTQQHLGIAMEYAAGGDMYRYTTKQRNGRLKEDHARWFFQQLIVALDYCHKMRVCNRDVKLDNTLLDGGTPPLIKLCDFGLSKNEDIDSAPKTLVGTPAYLAPEVLMCTQGRQYDGPAADVWSAGVALYTLLAGRYPFERVEDRQCRDRLQRMAERILLADYDVPADLGLSQQVQHLLALMLVADPTKRITIKNILQHPWYLQHLPPGVLQMNDCLDPPPEGLQSEEEIKRIVREAGSSHGHAQGCRPPATLNSGP